MKKWAYYNEFDPFAAAWLRELIKAGHSAPGEVDERSIEDVVPSDLVGYTQCHFFAGIGVWSYALRCAEWPDDRPVWTGSCPCQPFSAAGKGVGFADERHLWPAFHHLISVCRPSVVFGEQVASKDGLAWFDLVQADLEGEGYACGAVDTCAAGFGAPHIRQRLYWVANTLSRGRKGESQESRSSGTVDAKGKTAVKLSYLGNDDMRLAHTICGSMRMGDAIGTGLEGFPRDGNGEGGRQEQTRPATAPSQPCGVEHSSATHGHWGAADWLFCRDGKWRAIEPGLKPLAHGATNRVGRLRGYGNAIVAPQAEAFIGVYMEMDRA